MSNLKWLLSHLTNMTEIRRHGCENKVWKATCFIEVYWRSPPMYSHVIDWKQECNIRIISALIGKHSTQHSVMTIPWSMKAWCLPWWIDSLGGSYFSCRMSSSKWLFLKGEKLNLNISNDADCAENTWLNVRERSTGTTLAIRSPTCVLGTTKICLAPKCWFTSNCAIWLLWLVSLGSLTGEHSCFCHNLARKKPFYISSKHWN